ncbi:hypothetical protein BASA81_004182 [Batrachochytrium salamandrivorans]|nr:hypothetical protein BASA81_004182 [Batrachochytrium salamandrivorans]
MRTGGLDFERCQVGAGNPTSEFGESCMSLCGGPIAVVIDNCKLVVFTGGGMDQQLGEYSLPTTGANRSHGLVLFKFLPDLSLVLVFASGTILLWDEFALSPKPVCDMGSKISLVCVFGSSLVLLTDKLEELWLVEDLRFSTKRTKLSGKLPLAQSPRCFCVLKPWCGDEEQQHTLQVVVGIPDQSGIVIVHRNGNVEAHVPQFKHEPSRLLVAHPTENLICSLDLVDHLIVTNIEFDNVVYVDRRLEAVPKALDWIMGGAGFALGLVWSNAVEVVGFLGKLTTTNNVKPIRFHWEQHHSISCSFAEFDGLKVLSTNGEVDLIRRVPQCTLSKFGKGESLAARLISAVQAEFPQPIAQQHGEDEKDDEAILAACHELLDGCKFVIDSRRRLVLFKASQLGRDMLLKPSRELTSKFVLLIRLAKALPLVHGLHSATWLEVCELTPRVFASRLLSLGLVEQCKLFCQAMGEEELLRHPLAWHQAKLVQSDQGISCHAALGVVLQNKEMCDREENSAKRVIALLHCKAYERVVHVLSTQRGLDFDLKARAALSMATTATAIVVQNAVCEQAIRATLRQSRNPAKLEQWLLTVSQHTKRSIVERGMLLLQVAFKQQADSGGALDVDLMEQATKALEPHPFYQNQTRDFIKLLLLQREHKLPQGKSVGETLVHCFARNREEVCDKIRQRLQVRPHLLARCRLHGFALRNQFAEACRAVLTNEFGFQDYGIAIEDVVDLAFQQHAHSALSRIGFDVLPQGSPDKAKIFYRLRMYPEAIQFAQEGLCTEVLELMIQNCGANVELQTKAQLALDLVLEKQRHNSDRHSATARCNQQ